MRLIQAIHAGELPPSQAAADRVFSCLLCGACLKQCSAGVDIMEALYQARGLLRAADSKGRTLRWTIKAALKRPDLSSRLYRLIRPVVRPLLHRMGLPDTPLQGYTLRETGTVFSPPDGISKGRVVLFTGCSVNYIHPHLGESLIRVMNALGYEVVLPKREVCCGAPLRGLGLIDEARGFAYRNLEALRGLKADALISLCPTCVVTLKEGYRRMTGEGIDAVDAVGFLSGRTGLGAVLDAKAAYHDPCHALYGLDQYDEPRDLLKRVGLDVVDIGTGCCGLAGTFSLRFKALSEEMLRERAGGFGDSGAEIMVTSCPGCLFQLSKAVPPEKVFHLIEVVEEALLR